MPAKGHHLGLDQQRGGYKEQPGNGAGGGGAAANGIGGTDAGFHAVGLSILLLVMLPTSDPSGLVRTGGCVGSVGVIGTVWTGVGGGIGIGLLVKFNPLDLMKALRNSSGVMTTPP